MNTTLLFIYFLWAKGLSTNGTHFEMHPMYGDLQHMKMLGGQKFASDTEVESTVYQWLRQQSAPFFFASGIQKLVDRWEK